MRQVPGRAEPDRAGVADVELDQGPALRLELAGPAGRLAADFVSDFGQAFAGLQAGRRHRWAGDGRSRKASRKNTPCTASPTTAPDPCEQWVHVRKRFL